MIAPQKLKARGQKGINMEYQEFRAKTLEDAKTEASISLGVTSDRLDVIVVEEGSNGFLGIGSKNAVIKARIKEETETSVEEKKEAPAEKEVKVEAEKKVEKAAEPEKKSEAKEKKAVAVDPAAMQETAKVFLEDVFKAMNMEVIIKTSYDQEETCLNIDLAGAEMGVLIGKRGQTLDSLQYLVSLVINKDVDGYVRVKVDTENYRERRAKTLENLARNVAFKVKRTRRAVELEPMNPYERRIIHSALQNDRYVTTYSEGEEPYRHVVVVLKSNN